MSDCPQELHYTDSHEWVRLENDDTVAVGITEHAQSQLGDLVFVELPKIDTEVNKGDDLVVLESVKTAADVYAAVSGEVIAVNEQLEETPDLINQDPYGTGWIYKMKLSDSAELDQLMNADAYQAQISEE